MDLHQPDGNGTIYYLVDNLVTSLFYQLSGNTKSKFKSLKKSLESIIDAYRHHNLAYALDGGNDFRSIEMQAAYIYKYMASHANIIRSLLFYSCSFKDVPQIANAAINEKSLKVVAAGCGPGSELVGLIGFLRDLQVFDCIVNVCLLDICDSWTKIHKHVEKSLTECGWRIKFESIIQDVLSPLSNPVSKKIEECDIITFVKVVSCIESSPFLYPSLLAFLKKAPIGCILLYVDNRNVSLSVTFRKACFQCGFEKIFDKSGKMTSIALEEENILNKYFSKWFKALGHPPQRVSSITALIFRKISQESLLMQVNDKEEIPIPGLSDEEEISCRGDRKRKKNRKNFIVHPLANRDSNDPVSTEESDISSAYFYCDRGSKRRKYSDSLSEDTNKETSLDQRRPESSDTVSSFDSEEPLLCLSPKIENNFLDEKISINIEQDDLINVKESDDIFEEIGIIDLIQCEKQEDNHGKREIEENKVFQCARTKMWSFYKNI